MNGSIAIIGAGIGGLAAGVFLSRLGFEVTAETPTHVTMVWRQE